MGCRRLMRVARRALRRGDLDNPVWARLDRKLAIGRLWGLAREGAGRRDLGMRREAARLLEQRAAPIVTFLRPGYAARGDGLDCPTCEGRGYSERGFGVFAVSGTCWDCAGRGRPPEGRGAMTPTSAPASDVVIDHG